MLHIGKILPPPQSVGGQTHPKLAFLDGTVEKETYLIKKDELVKLKTELLERKRDFGRPASAGWIEPLRNWINDACSAEKLVSSEALDIKDVKGGTNRRLLDRIVLLDFKKPFDGSASLTINPERSRRIDLIPEYKSSYEKEILAKMQPKNFNFPSENPQSQIWSTSHFNCQTLVCAS